MYCINCGENLKHECREKELEKKYVIDLDAPLFIPGNLMLVSHKKGGKFEWDASKVVLHLEPEQQEGRTLKGTDLLKRLEGTPAFNANLLDYLLEHPVLIPEDWKRKNIFFWGTVYRFSGGSLCVRFLCWDDGQWCWGDRWLENDWDDQDPSAVRAN